MENKFGLEKFLKKSIEFFAHFFLERIELYPVSDHRQPLSVGMSASVVDRDGIGKSQRPLSP